MDLRLPKSFFVLALNISSIIILIRRALPLENLSYLLLPSRIRLEDAKNPLSVSQFDPKLPFLLHFHQ